MSILLLPIFILLTSVYAVRLHLVLDNGQVQTGNGRQALANAQANKHIPRHTSSCISVH